MQQGSSVQMELTDKYILLKDNTNKILLLYSKDGHFIKSISYKNLGDGFSPGYVERSNTIRFFGSNRNYTLTPKDRVKVKLDWNNPRNRKYFAKYTVDLNDPSLTLKKDVPNQKDIVGIYPFYDDYYTQIQITTSPLYKDSLDHELTFYKDNQVVKSYFPYNRINEPRFLYTTESITFNRTDTPYIHLVTRPYRDTVYKLVRDSLFPIYQIVLPLENTLPTSFFTQPFKNPTERDNFKRNNGWMLHQVYNFYETPKLIFFWVGYLANIDSYIYEKQTNTTYKTRNIRSDSSQYNLPLVTDYAIVRKGNRFYKAQKAGDLVAFFEKNKNIPVPKELEEFLKSKPPATAPVIVEFKFKN